VDGGGEVGNPLFPLLDRWVEEEDGLLSGVSCFACYLTLGSVASYTKEMTHKPKSFSF
jgi:hypothetical protein